VGTAQLDALLDMCGVWPRGPVDEDFHEPLEANIPVLLLSGTDDPVTPPAYAEQAKAGLPHSWHIVMQGFGHGQLGGSLHGPRDGELHRPRLDRGTRRLLSGARAAHAFLHVALRTAAVTVHS